MDNKTSAFLQDFVRRDFARGKEAGTCRLCGSFKTHAYHFRDCESWLAYMESFMCQECQDKEEVSAWQVI